MGSGLPLLKCQQLLPISHKPPSTLVRLNTSTYAGRMNMTLHGVRNQFCTMDMLDLDRPTRADNFDAVQRTLHTAVVCKLRLLPKILPPISASASIQGRLCLSARLLPPQQDSGMAIAFLTVSFSRGNAEGKLACKGLLEEGAIGYQIGLSCQYLSSIPASQRRSFSRKSDHRDVTLSMLSKELTRVRTNIMTDAHNEYPRAYKSREKRISFVYLAGALRDRRDATTLNSIPRYGYP